MVSPFALDFAGRFGIMSCGSAKPISIPDRGRLMRIEPFTMERDVLKVGDVVEITEGKLPRAYYYTAEPAAAMSRNFPANRRIRSKTGIVRSIILVGGTYQVDIEFDE